MGCFPFRAACLAAATAMVSAAPATTPEPSLAPEPSGADVPFDVLSPDLYRIVTLKWNGGSSPLCAVTRSRRDWAALTRTLAAGKGKENGAPTSDEWNRHAVLVVGRQIAAGSMPIGFHVEGVHRQASTIELDYTLDPVPPSGPTTWFAAVAILKPLSRTVTFKEDGRIVCSMQPMAGHWVTPTRPAPQPAPSEESQAAIPQPVPPGYAPSPYYPPPYPSAFSGPAPYSPAPYVPPRYPPAPYPPAPYTPGTYAPGTYGPGQ